MPRLKATEESGGLRRQDVCPQCGSRDVIDVLFGLPAWSPELKDAVDSGQVVLGGCCVSGDELDRHCKECGHAWRGPDPGGGNGG